MLPVERYVRDTIRAEGPIPFAQFMHLVLYSPRGGYYRSSTPVGAAGDYFTSPLAHPLFGALLAAQLAQMWEALARPDPFTVLEPGAGGGVMARDVVEAAHADFPRFARALRYVAVDYAAPTMPSPSGVQWVSSNSLPMRSVIGCVITNELLDALPVHRFVVEGGIPREVYVGLDGDAFAEALGAPASPDAARLLARVPSGLPDGYRGEVCPAAARWLAGAAAALDRGFVLTVDYGGLRQDLYAPHRQGGTLQCHYRHVATGNPYVRVGAQDVTAHVDFSLLREEGEAAGLTTLGYATQRDFLRNLGADVYLDALPGLGRPQPAFTSGVLPRQEYLANRMAMQALVDPEGLGRFRVLAQGKGVEGAVLWGLSPDNPRLEQLRRSVRSRRVPLLTASHLSLMDGKYPHVAQPQGWTDWEGGGTR